MLRMMKLVTAVLLWSRGSAFDPKLKPLMQRTGTEPMSRRAAMFFSGAAIFLAPLPSKAKDITITIPVPSFPTSVPELSVPTLPSVDEIIDSVPVKPKGILLAGGPSVHWLHAQRILDLTLFSQSRC